MAFNPLEYWRRKQARERLGGIRDFLASMRAVARLGGYFNRSPVMPDLGPEKGRHTRSAKERRMRRLRHRDRMRNRGRL